MLTVLSAEGVSVVYGDHFNRAVVLDLNRASFAQEPIECAINDNWNFRHGRGVQKRTNTWSARCSTFTARHNRYAEGHTCLRIARRFLVNLERRERVDNHFKFNVGLYTTANEAERKNGREAFGSRRTAAEKSESQKLEVTSRPRLQERRRLESRW